MNRHALSPTRWARNFGLLKPLDEMTVKHKIFSGDVSTGGWLLSGSPVLAEIMAASFDWVCIDAEHSTITKDAAANCVRAIESRGAEAFVRVGLNDELEIKRFLDIGVKGIIVPLIRSVDDVRRAIDRVFFPPIGRRSYSLARCTNYGATSDHYFATFNDRVFFSIMVETAEAVEALPRIIHEYGDRIDAVLIGLYDLAGSFGIPGQVDDENLLSNVQDVRRHCEERDVPVGIHATEISRTRLSELIKDGYTFIGCGMDTLYVLDQSEALGQVTEG